MDKRLSQQRWEVIVSAIATFALTVSAILQEDTAPLVEAYSRIGKAPYWIALSLRVPNPIWWLLTLALGAGLFYLGLRLSRRFGPLVLFAAPVIMLALQYGIPILLFGPIRAATPGAGS